MIAVAVDLWATDEGLQFFPLTSANSLTTLEKIFRRQRGLCASFTKPLAWLGAGGEKTDAMRFFNSKLML
jgi:hypothetical protein